MREGVDERRDPLGRRRRRLTEREKAHEPAHDSACRALAHGVALEPLELVDEPLRLTRTREATIPSDRARRLAGAEAAVAGSRSPVRRRLRRRDPARSRRSSPARRRWQIAAPTSASSQTGKATYSNTFAGTWVRVSPWKATAIVDSRRSWRASRACPAARSSNIPSSPASAASSPSERPATRVGAPMKTMRKSSGPSESRSAHAARGAQEWARIAIEIERAAMRDAEARRAAAASTRRSDRGRCRSACSGCDREGGDSAPRARVAPRWCS